MTRRGGLILSFGVWLAIAGLSVSTGIGQQPERGRRPDSPKAYRYEVLARYPHDREAFTQGLTYYDGFLYESTGLEGHSSLRKVDLITGRVEKKVDLDNKYFAEGLTILRGRIYQLTWLSGVGFTYDLATFQKTGEFHYEGEGWGLTNDGRSLIISDGSNRLRFVDPKDFRVQRSIDVFYQGKPLDQLNELEYINGEIYSNIWHKDLIARIDPATGKLLGMIDLAGLGAGLGLDSEEVLNGIANLPGCDCLLVTGKRWPLLFKIRLVVAGE
jgi:glutamine cyclotransferase